MTKKKPPKFTPKQKIFIENYLLTLNASESARRAGYPEKTAYIIGWENLRKPNIKAEIERRFSETAMSADEVLRRLGDMARASFDDILDEDGEFSILGAQMRGKTHLIKKIKHTHWTDTNGNTTRTTEVELHDAQAALTTLAKHHKLLSNVVELRDWRDKIIDALRQGKLKPLEVIQELGPEIATRLLNSAGIGTGEGGQIIESASVDAPTLDRDSAA